MPITTKTFSFYKQCWKIWMHMWGMWTRKNGVVNDFFLFEVKEKKRPQQLTSYATTTLTRYVFRNRWRITPDTILCFLRDYWLIVSSLSHAWQKHTLYDVTLSHNKPPRPHAPHHPYSNTDSYTAWYTIIDEYSHITHTRTLNTERTSSIDGDINGLHTWGREMQLQTHVTYC